ncbi:MAG: CocE/NonD family hydrolase, partial [Pseudomonadales bacterium]
MARYARCVALGILLCACHALGGDGAERYDGWLRFSEYVSARDGVKLAVDYYRPTFKGRLHKKRLPVVWQHTPYLRYRLDENGALPKVPKLPALAEGAQALLNAGYVFAVVDVRGSGASYGSSQLWIGPQQGRDAYDVSEWLAERSWSSGAIGMTGRSYLGTVQFFAAAENPPHLKAIFAEMAGFDNYSIFFSNGIYRADLPAAWRTMRAQLDYNAPLANGVFPPMGVAPVSADHSGELLAAAVRDHYNNRDLADTVRPLRFRDDSDSVSSLKPHIASSPWHLIDKIKASNIAVYQRAGWFDMYARDALLMFHNLSNPKKLLVGPWYHREHFGIDLDEERVRWFDYWLKGQENGFMSEPKLRYLLVGDKERWMQGDSWDEQKSERRRYFLNGQASGSARSLNDGGMGLEAISSERAYDTFTVDPYFTLGGTLQRNSGLWIERAQDCSSAVAAHWCATESGYPDTQGLVSNLLTYTSETLNEQAQLVGHASVDLWLEANQSDAGVFVTLEEVLPDGSSQYVAQSGMKASHRALNNPPFANFDLPWHGNYRADNSPLTDQAVRLQFVLPPVANVFEA